MKCIYCDKDSDYKTRVAKGRRCGSCGHSFAFEPKDENPKVSDEMFQKAIEDVSSRGSLYFTKANLGYALDRRVTRWKWKDSLGILVGIGFSSIFMAVVTDTVELVYAAFVFAAVILASPFVLRAWRRRYGREPRIAPRDFDRLLRRWQSVHGAVDKLLDGAAWGAPARAIIDPAINAELSRYSFDRAVVTDKAQPAALLVANKFHVDHECAVLSVDGYPGGTGPALLAMLRQNPELRVMALHDASAGGCALPLTLRGDSWFGEQARVIDLGLRPREGLSLGIPVLETFSAPLGPVKDLLTPREIAWLEQGKRIELDALPPARLMRVISQGFARFEEMLSGGAQPTNDSGIWYVVGDSDGDDASETFG